ncbi:MAG: hypothetical protein PHQ23_08160 [Candidatus Wallbacteria bacterium]|nr:hypothetical protein [Candidatus Wallbacteria bacterium]
MFGKAAIFCIVFLFSISASAEPEFMSLSLDFFLHRDSEQSFQGESIFPQKFSEMQVPETPEWKKTVERIVFQGTIRESRDRFFVMEGILPAAGGSFKSPARDNIHVVDSVVFLKDYNFRVIFVGSDIDWSVGVAGQDRKNEHWKTWENESYLSIGGDYNIRTHQKIRSSVSSRISNTDRELQFFTSMDIDF